MVTDWKKSLCLLWSVIVCNFLHEVLLLCNPCLHITEVVSSMNHAAEFLSNWCSTNSLCWHKAFPPVWCLFPSTSQESKYMHLKEVAECFILTVAFAEKANLLLSNCTFSLSKSINSYSSQKQGSISCSCSHHCSNYYGRTIIRKYVEMI